MTRKGWLCDTTFRELIGLWAFFKNNRFLSDSFLNYLLMTTVFCSICFLLGLILPSGRYIWPNKRPHPSRQRQQQQQGREAEQTIPTTSRLLRNEIDHGMWCLEAYSVGRWWWRLWSTRWAFGACPKIRLCTCFQIDDNDGAFVLAFAHTHLFLFSHTSSCPCFAPCPMNYIQRYVGQFWSTIDPGNLSLHVHHHGLVGRFVCQFWFSIPIVIWRRQQQWEWRNLSTPPQLYHN